MHDAQRAVEAFHRAKQVTVGKDPAIRDAGLRAALIWEEAAETVTAIEEGNLLDAID